MYKIFNKRFAFKKVMTFIMEKLPAAASEKLANNDKPDRYGENKTIIGKIKHLNKL